MQLKQSRAGLAEITIIIVTECLVDRSFSMGVGVHILPELNTAVILQSPISMRCLIYDYLNVLQCCDSSPMVPVGCLEMHSMHIRIFF